MAQFSFIKSRGINLGLKTVPSGANFKMTGTFVRLAHIKITTDSIKNQERLYILSCYELKSVDCI